MPYLASDTRYNSMTYNRVGRSGLKLPAISLGWWYNFGGLDNLENGRAIARRAFDLGITHFDLANNYGPPPGSAEENFGTLFRQDFHPYRDELIISTKAGYDMWPGPYGEWGSRKYLLASLDQSLKRMGLDYVDIFYSHLAQGMLTDKYLEGIPPDSRAASDGSLSPDMLTDEALAHVRALNALARGRGQTLAQMAIAWTLRDPRVTSSLIGARSVAQLEDSLGALRGLAFSDDELAQIDRHAVEAGINLWAPSSSA